MANSIFSISQVLTVNHNFWFNCLSQDESGPTNRITEDIDASIFTQEIPFTYIKIASKDELINQLRDIANRANGGLRPIINFDAHGNAANGIHINDSGEYISWNDLVNELRKINITTDNNLVCVFSCCHAYNICFQIHLNETTPFFLLIAPPREVVCGFLEDEMPNFYKELELTESFTQAFDKTLKSKMMMYHCQWFLFEIMAMYLVTYCRGIAKEKRIEDLITKALEKYNIVQPRKEQIQYFRKYMKSKVKPNQELLDQYVAKFLLGKKPDFDFEDVKKIAEAYPSKYIYLKNSRSS